MAVLVENRDDSRIGELEELRVGSATWSGKVAADWSRDFLRIQGVFG